MHMRQLRAQFSEHSSHLTVLIACQPCHHPCTNICDHQCVILLCTKGRINTEIQAGVRVRIRVVSRQLPREGYNQGYSSGWGCCFLQTFSERGLFELGAFKFDTTTTSKLIRLGVRVRVRVAVRVRGGVRVWVRICGLAKLP